MKKTFLILTLLSMASSSVFAQKEHELKEVVVSGSTKETNNLHNLPSAVTVITPQKISIRGIESLKDISTLVPNLYIPDYGSKMTTPVYLRGIGTRSSNQSVGVYVDGIPYMDKSTFDFELMDIQSIEILRGPQGTLYGRNAMGGIINIHTLSPIDYQGTKISIGGGNYGNYSAKLSHYAPLTRNSGIAVSGYYDRGAGYFTNEFNGKKVDPEQSAGGRLKYDIRFNTRLTMKLETSFDYTDQGAFAYGLYDTETLEVSPVKYNDPGTYRRAMSNNNLRFEYLTDKVLFSSNTGYQYLDDDMMMDQDFTEKDIFTINQRQKQHSFNQEFAARSVGSGRYQWSVGLFAFHNDMKVNGDVTFKKDGISEVIQPKIDQEMTEAGAPMRLVITDEVIPNPGTYKTPSTGVALFHQSTFNFTDKFSMTAGIRLDYEKQRLEYNSSMAMNTSVVMKPPKPPVVVGQYPFEKTLSGSLDQDFTQFLPKISAKYALNNQAIVYATVSKGYKAGGYNNQMFSEVVQDSIKAMRPAGMPKPQPKGDGDLSKVVSYRPETTWNYEAGFRGTFINGALGIDASVFYMDVKNLQLTQFVNGGSGRILTNSGHGRSYGFELSANVDPISNLSLDFNYGYTNAKFTKYDAGENKDGEKIDYTGNYIPYTPQNTFSAGTTYYIPFSRGFIDQITLSANYNGCGEIYWTEKNDISQSFYGLVNAKVSLHHKNIRLDLWGKNLTSEKYGAFYFESFGKTFLQLGKPLTFGANLTFTF